MRHGNLHSIGAKLAYTDTQLKVLIYAMKQNSDIHVLWYPIKNVDTQFTKKKKNGAYLPNDLKFLSGAMYHENKKQNYFKLYEPPHDKTNKMICAPSEDSDQPGPWKPEARNQTRPSFYACPGHQHFDDDLIKNEWATVQFEGFFSFPPIPVGNKTEGANKPAHWDGWENENPLELYCSMETTFSHYKIMGNFLDLKGS